MHCVHSQAFWRSVFVPHHHTKWLVRVSSTFIGIYPYFGGLFLNFGWRLESGASLALPPSFHQQLYAHPTPIHLNNNANYELAATPRTRTRSVRPITTPIYIKGVSCLQSRRFVRNHISDASISLQGSGSQRSTLIVSAIQ